jgi:hypothetical protein
MRAYAILTVLLIVGVGACALATLRPGLNWDGDAALYIMNARNIAEGRPYSATNFIPNPLNAIHPAAYPPGLPLLLAGVYRISGVDLERMKWACIATLLLFLAVLARITREELPWPLALATVAAVGLHPYMMYLKDSIFSELPFLLCCYAALLGLNRLDDKDRPATSLTVVVTGIAVALAYLTRSIGVVLFPVAVLSAIAHGRRTLLNPTTVALAIAAVLALAVQSIFPNDVKTYAGSFQDFRVADLLQGALRYAGATHTFIGGKVLFHSALRTNALIVALTVLALWGFIERIRVRWSIYEIFCVTYAALLLIYPIKLEPERYSLPLWPLILMYSFGGARALGALLGKRWEAIVPAGLTLVLVVLYVMRFADDDFGPIPQSVTAAESVALFDAIQTRVPRDAVLLTGKPTVIALLGDRRAATWPEHFTDEELWAYLHLIGASYIVQGAGRMDNDDRTHDPEADLKGFIDHNRAFLTAIFASPLFTLYRISERPATSRG